MPLYIKAIDPALHILGNQQQFINTQATSSYQLWNQQVPTPSIPVNTHLDWRNAASYGFRLGHLSETSDTVGQFQLSAFTPSGSSETLLTWNESGSDQFRFTKSVSIDGVLSVSGGTPVNPNDLVTKSYVDQADTQTLSTAQTYTDAMASPILSTAQTYTDSTASATLASAHSYTDGHTWTSAQITDFQSAVNNRTLDSFTKSPLDMWGYTITHLPVPTAPSHAATKDYVDTRSYTASQITDFSSAVTNRTLDGFTKGHLNMGGYTLTNLASPWAQTMAATKEYVDTHALSYTNGEWNALASLIANVANPARSTDAATKGYVDGLVGSAATQSWVTNTFVTQSYMSSYLAPYSWVQSNFPSYSWVQQNTWLGYGQASYVNTGSTTSIGSSSYYLNVNPSNALVSLVNMTLDIPSGRYTYTGQSYYYYAYGTYGSPASAYGVYYSITCGNRVGASEFNAYSSIKRKRVLERDPDVLIAEVLPKFRALPIVKYQYKDPFQDGWGDYVGLIAEETAELFPHIVDMQHEGWVPSILRHAVVEDLGNGQVRLKRMDGDGFPPITASRIQVIHDQQPIDCDRTGLEVDADGYVIRMPTPPLQDGDTVFVYGTYECSPTIAKGKIGEVALLVLQHVLNRLDALESVQHAVDKPVDNSVDNR